MNYQIFSDASYNKIFNQYGYLYSGKIEKTLINRLLNIDYELNIPDSVGCDFNVGMNTNEYDLRFRMQDKLFEILRPYFQLILPEYDFFSATIINKTPTKKFLITAHQDFTYTNEPEEPSFMCWIPLVDSDISNGVIGFIPKSHLFYDYKRAFPFPFVVSPVVKNEFELMKYLKFKPMNAGEIVYFFNKTIHGSFANYTNSTRYALNISFIKKNSNSFIYIRNPKNEIEFFKYNADKYFLINYNNPSIQQMFTNGKIEIKNYEFLGTEQCDISEINLRNIKMKLKEFGVTKSNNSILLLWKYRLNNIFRIISDFVNKFLKF